MARTLWRLTFFLVAVAISFPALAVVAHDGAFSSQGAALAACQSDAAAWSAPGASSYTNWYCRLSSAASYGLTRTGADSSFWGTYTFPVGDPGAICKARPSYSTSTPGNLTLCNAGCSYKPAAGQEVWTVRGITGHSTTGGGGQMVPTGEQCGSGPLVTTDPLPANQPVPKLCGGGSCVDTASGQACALNGAGQQVCVKLPKGSPGTCATGGDTTLCAGNPAPTPPNPPITDPASQIASSDHFTRQTDNGPINNTTVNNYNNTGADANPGKGAGDTDGKGDKPDDQKKDDGTTASGGGDCTTPPMVEGSAALGMIARQEWLLRCADAGQGADDSDKTVPGLEGISETHGDGFKKEVSVLDKLDSSGFGGGGTCPRLPDIDLGAFGHLAMQGDWWCDLLTTARYVILLLGMWVALRILGEK